jgi:hypothetical protein
MPARRVFTEGVDANGDRWYLRPSGPPTFNAAQGSWCLIEGYPEGNNLYQQTGSGTTNEWTLVSEHDIYDKGNLTGEVAVDWDLAASQYGEQTGTITGTSFSNMSRGVWYTLQVSCGSSLTWDWGSAVNKWYTSNGNAPTPTTTSGKFDTYFFFKNQDDLVFGGVLQGA